MRSQCEHTQSSQSNISGVSEVCRFLFGRRESIGRICDLCCDCKACSPFLEKMINFCYLHYCPEGFSVGLTHLSFPLRCFSNGNEIECAASWVRLAKTLLSREDANKKKEGERKKQLFAHNKTSVSTRFCSTHKHCSLLALVNNSLSQCS